MSVGKFAFQLLVCLLCHVIKQEAHVSLPFVYCFRRSGRQGKMNWIPRDDWCREVNPRLSRGMYRLPFQASQHWRGEDLAIDPCPLERLLWSANKSVHRCALARSTCLFTSTTWIDFGRLLLPKGVRPSTSVDVSSLLWIKRLHPHNTAAIHTFSHVERDFRAVP